MQYGIYFLLLLLFYCCKYPAVSRLYFLKKILLLLLAVLLIITRPEAAAWGILFSCLLGWCLWRNNKKNLFRYCTFYSRLRLQPLPCLSFGSITSVTLFLIPIMQKYRTTGCTILPKVLNMPLVLWFLIIIYLPSYLQY